MSEHAFDKLRSIDCGFAEFAAALDDADVIEERVLVVEGQLKELLLVLQWIRPVHVVVVVDDIRTEERIVTLYEPDPSHWTNGYRRRR